MMKAAGSIVYVTEVDPICALQASMEGFSVVTLQSVLSIADIFITTTGNFNIIMAGDMQKMKNTTRENIKPQVDKFVFQDGHGVIVLAEGRLLNLGCATGHPSFVMSSSFTNQTLAQIELWQNKDSGKYESCATGCPKPGKVYILPKVLDEKVAALHLGSLGVERTKLTKEQADYIGVPEAGPFKPAHYRY